MAQQRTNVWIDNGAQAGATLKALQKEVAKLNSEIRNLPRNSDEYKKKVLELRDANTALGKHRAEIRGVSDGFQASSKSVLGMLKQLAPMSAMFLTITGAASGLFGLIGGSVRSIAEFDSAMSSLGTLTGSKGNALKEMRAEVLALSTETGKGAADIAKAMELVGGANSDLLNNKEALADVTKQAILLAKASGMEIPAAAEAVTKSMNQFGASANEASKYTDILTTSQMKGTATIEQLAESMVNGGSTAKAFKLSFEETNAILQGFAKGGTVGSEAGTQMSGILSKLSKVQNKDFNPAFTNAIDVIDNLAKANLSYTDLVKLTDAEGAKWLSTLLNQNETVQSLNGTLYEAGATQAAAAQNTDNLAGNYEKLKVNLENYLLGSEGATGASEALNWVLKQLAGNVDGVIKTILKAIGVFLIYKGVQKAMKIREAALEWIQQASAVDKNTSALTKNTNEAKNAASSAGGLKSALKNIGWTSAIALAAEFAMALWDVASGAAEARAQAEALQKAQEKNNSKADSKIANSQKKLDKELAELRRKRNEGIIKSDAQLHKLEEEAISRASKRLKTQVSNNKEAIKEMSADYKKAQEYVKKVEAGGGPSVLNQQELANYMTAKKVIIQLGAEKKALAGAEKKYTAELDNLNESLKDANSNQKVATKEAISSGKALKKQSEAANHLKDVLDDLIKKVDEFQSSNDYENELAKYADGLDKELFELQHNLDAKYNAEIEKAKELASAKGEIGLKGQEQLDRLLQIKEQEFLRESNEIREKYTKEAREKEVEDQKTANLNKIAQEESLQEALIQIKVARAQAAYKAVNEADIEGRKAAFIELQKALEAQLEYEKNRKIEALLDQYDKEEINAQELKDRKLEAEQEYLDSIEEMHQQTADKIAEINTKRFEDALNTVSQWLDISMKFSDAKAQKETNKQKKRSDAENKVLKDKLDAQLITQDEYDKQKAALDAKNELELSRIQNEQAKKRKAAAIAEAVINGAIAISKVLAQTGVGSLIAVPLIAASTAAQIALIQSTDVNQYADGGYTNVIGRKDGLRYRAKNVGKLRGGYTPNNPSLALISEKGNEYFVPHHLMKNKAVANHVAMIEAVRTNQFADGGYTQGTGGTAGMDLTSIIENNTEVMKLLYKRIPNMKAVVDDKQSKNIVEKASGLRRYRP